MKRDKEDDFVMNDKTCRRIADEIAEIVKHVPKDKMTDGFLWVIIYGYLKRDKNNRTED